MSDQQQQWKNDAQQLKKDLDSRPKQVVKREVPIQFGGIKATETPSESTQKPATGAKHAGPKRTDDFFKRQLGLS